MSASPLQVLCGHHDAVTCVTIVTELDMAVSGSKVTFTVVQFMIK